MLSMSIVTALYSSAMYDVANVIAAVSKGGLGKERNGS